MWSQSEALYVIARLGIWAAGFGIGLRIFSGSPSNLRKAFFFGVAAVWVVQGIAFAGCLILFSRINR